MPVLVLNFVEDAWKSLQSSETEREREREKEREREREREREVVMIKKCQYYDIDI